MPSTYFGEGNGNPLQCFCLENPRDGGAWWAAVYGVAQSRTRLKRLSSSSSSSTYLSYMDFVPFDHFHPIPLSPNTPTFGNKSVYEFGFFSSSLSLFFFKIPLMSDIMYLPFFDLIHLAECL